MEGRDEKGRFTKGNPSNPGNDFASKYNPEYDDRMIEWFKQRLEEGKYPTFERFAVFELGVDDDTLDNWANKFPGFRRAKKICESMQIADLKEGGLEERYNSAFTKFVMSACHGLSEKTETDSSITLKVAMNQATDEESN